MTTTIACRDRLAEELGRNTDFVVISDLTATEVVAIIALLMPAYERVVGRSAPVTDLVGKPGSPSPQGDTMNAMTKASVRLLPLPSSEILDTGGFGHTALMRDIEAIDSELGLLRAIRRMVREVEGQPPFTARIDALLDERASVR
jgi:hypothetical protein